MFLIPNHILPTCTKSIFTSSSKFYHHLHQLFTNSLSLPKFMLIFIVKIGSILLFSSSGKHQSYYPTGCQAAGIHWLNLFCMIYVFKSLMLSHNADMNNSFGIIFIKINIIKVNMIKISSNTVLEIAVRHQTLIKNIMSGTHVSKQDILFYTLSLSIIS